MPLWYRMLQQEEGKGGIKHACREDYCDQHSCLVA
jgi:hypothetical protein